jgi:hypothetical protein
LSDKPFRVLGLGRQLGYRASAADLLEVVDSSPSGMHEPFYVYVAAADYMSVYPMMSTC